MEDYPRTILELEDRFPTEEACREYLFRLRWPQGFRCPRCGHGRAWARSVAAYSGRPGALCRYGDDDPLDYETESAMLMYPAKCQAEVCLSHADRDPWYRVSLEHEGGGLTLV